MLSGCPAEPLCNSHRRRTPAPCRAQPAPRARHTAVPLDGRRLLVWGGLDSKQRFQDLWLLDVAAKQWAAVEVQGAPPPARAHHTGRRLGQGAGGCWPAALPAAIDDLR